MAADSASAGRGAGNLMRQREIAGSLRTFSHPWNAKSEMRGVALGAAMGFRRVGINFIRIAPGREAYAPHAHAHEEEWVFILEGRGRVLAGDQTFDVGPGDFLAYPAPQVVHHIVNAGKSDLVCLMGGEVLPLDVVDFPRHRKRMVWVNGRVTAYDMDKGENPFAPKPVELKPQPVSKTRSSTQKKKKAPAKSKGSRSKGPLSNGKAR
jgi:uncharacterized cupin superfamily protein